MDRISFRGNGEVIGADRNHLRKDPAGRARVTNARDKGPWDPQFGLRRAASPPRQTVKHPLLVLPRIPRKLEDTSDEKVTGTYEDGSE